MRPEGTGSATTFGEGVGRAAGLFFDDAWREFEVRDMQFRSLCYL